METIAGASIERVGSEIPRVSTRYPVSLQVSWHLPKSGLALRPKIVPARLIDLSLAGAAVEIKAIKKAKVGDAATFELAGRRGRVQIRYIVRPANQPEMMHVGVAFSRLDDELWAAISHFVDRQAEMRRRRINA